MCGDNLTVTEPYNEMQDEDIELKRIVAERESQPETKVDIDDL